MMGKLYVVGFGPGHRAHATPAAVDAITRSDFVVTYKGYAQMLDGLVEPERLVSSGMREEVSRASKALVLADEGHTVTLVSDGDTGIYGMASIVLECSEETGRYSDIEIVPGITAASAAASCLGAPLSHDFAVISLSDLLTPWELIARRIDAASRADFVIALYNPRSAGRPDHLFRARDVMLESKNPSTPVGIVRNALRAEQHVIVTCLGDLDDRYPVDMRCTVIIGNSQTRVVEGKIVTPRGYRL